MDLDNSFAGSAPSYQLESSDGESDWEGEDGVPTSSRTKPLAADAVITFEGGQATSGGEVIFLLGEAGERMNVSVAGKGIEVLVDGEQVKSLLRLVYTRMDDADASVVQVGSIHSSTPNTPTLVFLSTSVRLAALYPLSTALLRTLAPERSTILASYHFPSYITTAEAQADSPPLLYLRSHPTPSLEKLKKQGTLDPFAPPNLLHALPASLLTLSTFSALQSTLILFPTASAPQPLNGPWSQNAPSTETSLFDIGPLSEKGGMFGLVEKKVKVLAKELGWSWLESGTGAGAGRVKGFAWLDAQRKTKRREQMGSMYM